MGNETVRSNSIRIEKSACLETRRWSIAAPVGLVSSSVSSRPLSAKAGDERPQVSNGNEE